jgi:hypothetical protein
MVKPNPQIFIIVAFSQAFEQGIQEGIPYIGFRNTMLEGGWAELKIDAHICSLPLAYYFLGILSLFNQWLICNKNRKERSGSAHGQKRLLCHRYHCFLWKSPLTSPLSFHPRYTAQLSAKSFPPDLRPVPCLG